MNRASSLVFLGLVGAIAVSACKGKEPEPLAIPVPSGAPVAAVSADSTANAAGTQAAPGTAASGSSAAQATPPAAAPPAAPTPATPVRSESIDACCSALAAVSKSGKPAAVKAKSAVAATICSGAAARVKKGETTRSSALTTIRAQLAGAGVPPECN